MLIPTSMQTLVGSVLLYTSEIGETNAPEFHERLSRELRKSIEKVNHMRIFNIFS